MRISDWSSDVCSSDLPNGGTLNGTTCQTSSSSPASVTYSCPSGGTLSGNVCNTSSTLPATVTHTCPSGGVLNGTTCTIVTSTSASPVYYCRSEEHTSELQSLMRISYAVFCLKKKKHT